MALPDIEYVVKLYDGAKTQRQPLEDDWRMAAAHTLPKDYAKWASLQGPPQNAAYSGREVRRVAYDTTGALSLPKYVAVLERLATPAGQKWHQLQATDRSLRKKRRVKEYMDSLSHVLFTERYRPRAGFRVGSNEVYRSMGVYGSGPLYIGKRKRSVRDRKSGLRYVACSMRDTFVIVDEEGAVVGFFRRMWFNARQYKTKFGEKNVPKSIMAELAKPTPSESTYFEIVHFVHERDGHDHDPQSLGVNRHPVMGSYFAAQDKQYVGDEQGYAEMPYLMPRTYTVSEHPYGYSPALAALGALGSASAIKKTNLKHGNKAVDPPLFTHGMNAVGQVDQKPGAVNPGYVGAKGEQLVRSLQLGNARVAEALLEGERLDIQDAFLVTLFQILTETPEMTATEVVERVAEKMALLSPTMGQLQTEFLGPSIEREISVLAELGMLPPMPPELVEAEGEYDVVYTSPLAKAMYAEEVSGFMRALELALRHVEATQDLSALDHFDMDKAIPEISDTLAVPVRWMRTLKAVEQKRAQRSQEQAQAQMVENASGLAAAASVATEAT